MDCRAPGDALVLSLNHSWRSGESHAGDVQPRAAKSDRVEGRRPGQRQVRVVLEKWVPGRRVLSGNGPLVRARMFLRIERSLERGIVADGLEIGAGHGQCFRT